MKKIAITLLALVAFAGTAFAAAAPEKVVITSKKGNITFGHKTHVDGGSYKNCKACHKEDAGGKIGTVGMKQGHANCLDCHKKANNPKAPTACGDCHKK